MLGNSGLFTPFEVPPFSTEQKYSTNVSRSQTKHLVMDITPLLLGDHLQSHTYSRRSLASQERI